MDSIINIIPLIIFLLLGCFMIRIWFIDEGDMNRLDSFIMLGKEMTQLLTFLQGKKTTIGAILALMITYSLTKGYIDNDLAIMLNGILIVLGIGANVGTAKMVK